MAVFQNTIIDRVAAFRCFMIDSIGAAPDDIIADGKLHRFKIDGKLNGAYVLHPDGRVAGYVQDFKQGIKKTWRPDGDFRTLTLDERRTFAIERQRQALEREQATIKDHQQAAEKAVWIWTNAEPVMSHGYLVKKRIQSYGARLYKGALVIPLYSESLKLVNLQFIAADGTKRFLSGGQKKCCFWWLGKKSSTVLLAEGFATAASLHEHTGHQTFIGFDAGNLINVAKTVRVKNPDAEIIICGDNDLSGVGQSAARAAALACGGKYLIPEQAGMDFNDVLTAEVSL